MKNLDAILPELANYIAHHNQSNKAISEVAVGWHLEHSLLVIKQITATVAQSEPKLYKSKFNVKRFIVFLTKIIPRGKAKAPKVVIPVDEITIETLQESLKKAPKSNEDLLSLYKADATKLKGILEKNNLKIKKEEDFIKCIATLNEN